MHSNFLAVMACRTYDNDFGGVSSITKRSLNALTGHRTVSIQEAVHEIDRLELRICSDYLTNVRISKALFLRRTKREKTYKKDDLVSCYRNRPSSLDTLSLEQFFYQKFLKQKFYTDKETSRDKNRILVPQGMNCRPRYPVDYDYARGMLIMHKPWSVRDPLDSLLQDKQKTISEFNDLLGRRLLPLHVLSEYHRAVKYSQQYKIELLAKEFTSTEESGLDNIDNEQFIEHEHGRYLSNHDEARISNVFAGMHADVGLDHDWSRPFFAPPRASNTMNGECYTDYLRECMYENGSPEQLFIPSKNDGSDYKLDDLSSEQQLIVLGAIDAIVKFLTNDPEYKPFRATVLGSGGTGKSHVINTLVSIIRNMTKCNDTVQVAAPSGGAAYNIGGCTLHRLLDLSTDAEKLSKPLSDERKDSLKKNLTRLLCLVVDERSMLSSDLLGAAERNVRHCIYNGMNKNELWGGLPVTLLFGDDYQLFPIKSGAIEGYAKMKGMKQSHSTSNSTNQQLLNAHGNYLFIEEMTNHVFVLTENFRVKDPIFRNLLKKLRIGELDDDGAERLMKQNLFNFNVEDKARIENDPKTVWLFTTNAGKNDKNLQKLVHLSNQSKNPIACLSCDWISNRTQTCGVASVVQSHFRGINNTVKKTNLCVGAPVALQGINIVPELGLYNGARGIVMDIVYDTMEGPNNKHLNHLPRYVVVEFPGLKLPDHIKPWDSLHPTVRADRTIEQARLHDYLKECLTTFLCLICHQHVPIRMQLTNCNRSFGNPCCSVRYCPLVLAWASTVHKFQVSALRCAF